MMYCGVLDMQADVAGRRRFRSHSLTGNGCIQLAAESRPRGNSRLGWRSAVADR
jgi:hypothetical protein